MAGNEIGEVKVLISDMRGEFREKFGRMEERQANIAEDVADTGSNVRTALDGFARVAGEQKRLDDKIDASHKEIVLRLVPIEEAVAFWNKTIRQIALRSALAGGGITSVIQLILAGIAKKLGLI